MEVGGVFLQPLSMKNSISFSSIANDSLFIVEQCDICTKQYDSVDNYNENVF